MSKGGGGNPTLNVLWWVTVCCLMYISRFLSEISHLDKHYRKIACNMDIRFHRVADDLAMLDMALKRQLVRCFECEIDLKR